MSEIIKGISNLFASIFQVLEGTIKTIVNTIIGAISTVLDVIIGLFKSLFSLAEGVIGLVIGNAVLILIAIAGYFAYVQYQQRQGRRVEPIGAKVKKNL